MKKILFILGLVFLALILIYFAAPSSDYTKTKENIPTVGYLDYIKSWWKAKYTETCKQDNDLTYQGGELPEITVTPNKQ